MVLVAQSTDRDSTVVSNRWDLDGDGAFDDGQGRELSRSYRVAGTYTLRVCLTNNFGRTTARKATLTVR